MPSKVGLSSGEKAGIIVGAMFYLFVAVCISSGIIKDRRDMFPKWVFKDGCLSALAVFLGLLLGLLWPVLLAGAILGLVLKLIASLLSNIKKYETCCGVSTARWVKEQPLEEGIGAPDQVVVDEPSQQEAMCQKEAELSLTPIQSASNYEPLTPPPVYQPN